MTKVQRTEPAYVQVAAQLRRRIVSGELAESVKLPSTAKLAEAMGVTAPTVSRAFALLAKEGLVVTERRRGAFVEPRTKWQLKTEK